MTHKLKFQGIFVFYCLCMGVLIGVLAALFLTIVNFLIHTVWSSLPVYFDTPFYPLIVGLLGGLLIGLLQSKVGDYPKTMHNTLDEFRETNKIDYKNNQLLKNFVAATIVLTFGASLGPEAALVSLLGGLISWFGDLMKWTLARKEVLLGLGFGTLLSVVFRAPFAGAAVPLEAELETATIRIKWKKILLYLLTTAAGIFGFSQINQLFPKEAVFALRFPEVYWRKEVLLLILPALILGGVFGYLFLAIEKGTDFIADKIKEPLILCLIAGFFIGIFGMISPYLLFSGEHEIFEFSKEAVAMGTVTLVLLAFGKALLTNICFSFKWRGGKIFPAIFASASIGFALANLFPYTPALIVGIVVATSVTIILKQPLVVGTLLLFLFPVQFFPFILLSCLLAGKFSTWMTARLSQA